MSDALLKVGFLSGGSQLRRIYEKMQISGDKVYAEAGINFKTTWFPVYYVLAQSKQPQTVMEITRQIAFTHITVKNIIKELQKVGLIHVVPNPEDKRSKLISLSAEGAQLLHRLQPVWLKFHKALKTLLSLGHPDFNNILKRIDNALEKSPINERVNNSAQSTLYIMDFYPELKEFFPKLIRPWLLTVNDGHISEEEAYLLRNPEKELLHQGGFLLFARYENEVIGCLALKRLNPKSLELTHLFIKPAVRQKGFATLLLQRGITRALENDIEAIWYQAQGHSLFTTPLFTHWGFNATKAMEKMEMKHDVKQVLCLKLAHELI